MLALYRVLSHVQYAIISLSDAAAVDKYISVLKMGVLEDKTALIEFRAVRPIFRKIYFVSLCVIQSAESEFVCDCVVVQKYSVMLHSLNVGIFIDKPT